MHENAEAIQKENAIGNPGASYAKSLYIPISRRFKNVWRHRNRDQAGNLRTMTE